MRVDVLTIFPEMFGEVLDTSIIKRARERGIVRIRVHDLRRFTHDRRRTVDDRPYGGGPGMVMRPEPIFEAVEAIRNEQEAEAAPRRGRTQRRAANGRATTGRRLVILLSPAGEPLTQAMAKQLSGYESLLLLCGHYEGVDERVRQALADREISIGDYVLTGGELPAMVIIDAVTRLLPGALGDEDSTSEESFSDGTLEYPQYTRPPVYRGLGVPDVLRSGNHAEVAAWRKREARARTSARRPELCAPRRRSKE